MNPSKDNQEPVNNAPQNQQTDSQQPAGQSQQQERMLQPQDLQPQVVYMARPLEPQHQTISPEIQRKHAESKQRFPSLNLSEGEYIITAIKRHPIGLVQIWVAVAAVILALFALIALFAFSTGQSDVSSSSSLGGTLSPAVLIIPAMLISLLALIFGFISAYIYSANEFFLTNESIIQHIQTSLFHHREQTISLANVEDASYTQDGVLPHLFNYGMLRLSTQGDETTYRFNYASDPNKQIATLNDAVENFKNIRPMHSNG